MTVDTIICLKDLIDECQGTDDIVVSAWVYVNRMNGKTMFAAFTQSCYCDICESPAVLRPRLIYRSGKFIGEYKFMNKVV